jgi:hypothetical protein
MNFAGQEFMFVSNRITLKISFTNGDKLETSCRQLRHLTKNSASELTVKIFLFLPEH